VGRELFVEGFEAVTRLLTVFAVGGWELLSRASASETCFFGRPRVAFVGATSALLDAVAAFFAGLPRAVVFVAGG